MTSLRIFNARRRFRAIRRFPAKIIASIRSKKTNVSTTCDRIDADALNDAFTISNGSTTDESGSLYSGPVTTESDAVWDTEVDTDFESLSMRESKMPPPKEPIEPVMNLLALPTNVLETIITHLDTGALHAFRHTSRHAAALTAFRGIQTHMLHVDPEMPSGQVHSIQSKGKIITSAAIDAVLHTERVKVRHLLKIGAFHPADMTYVAEHIDSRFPSVVLEGCVNYKIFYSLIVVGKTITMRLKDGIQLPKSKNSRFWHYFPNQSINQVRKSFNSNHVFVKATYHFMTDTHTLRVVPAPDWRPLYG